MAVVTSISKFSERHLKIRRFIFMVFALLVSFNITFSQTADTTLTKLFQNSYKVIDAMRLPGGFYLDALALGGAGAKPAALNANGVGLISLCIADSMYKKTGDSVNWDANAESKALQTIDEWIRLKNTPGATNVNGLFHRYFKPTDGSWVWVTEHSTIDNALLAAGFLFCKNYFHHNSEIVEKTSTLLNSMDFTAAISAQGDKMYMILDDNGNTSVQANPFNEYLILAWFAKNSNPSFPRYASAQTYWNNKFSNASSLPKFSYPDGNATLSEWTNSAQPSFHVQFCFYYCNYFGKNDDYMTYFKNAATADKTWWQNNTSQQTAWGCGAGEIPGGGYSADAVNKNPQRIVSPHILIGFSPINAELRNDLIALYDDGNGNGIYQIPATSRDFIWRYKLNEPNIKTSYVQAVDFSTFLYGLAALPEYLGPEFFTKYNDFDFNPTTAVNEEKMNKSQLENSPNPFRNQTNISFEITEKAKVVLEIYNLSGQKIKKLLNNEMSAGKHTVQWNARNEHNLQIEPGVYICRMLIDNQSQFSKQILVIK
ncbi:MAG: T9SS type A sorting domain-containing protein [Draconibacterium sp.]|nr:T9SS type A sorting domain-containing protein [Draconibacterium sp.]